MKNPWKIFKEWDERRWQKHGLKRWEHTRLKGKMRFVLGGAIFMALFVTVFNAIWSWIETNGWSIHGITPPNFYRDLFIKPIAWFIGGWVSSAWTWNRTEKEYLKLKEGQPVEAQNAST
jgi:hypothetical protein